MFRQRCRPQGDYRIDQILEFLALIQEAFQCPNLYDSNSRVVDLKKESLLKIFEKAAKRLLPDLGATEFFYTIAPKKRDNNTVAVEIHTGTKPGEVLIDTYNISMDNPSKLPKFDYFCKFIEIFEPFEAFVAETDNEFTLDSYNRQHDIPQFSRPAIIRGFHYLDEAMARSIGGISYCLKAPAWHVEEFCNGVLIWLVPAPFDSGNAEHLEAQKEIMDYFKMPYSKKNNS